MLSSTHILSQLALLNQFHKSERIEFDFKAWLTYQNYYIDENISKNSFSLRVIDESFFKAIGNDCDKFARFSLETLCAIQPNRIFRKNSSWPTINSYYASFFAAHSLLRMFGISYSQLNFDHLNKILELANILGKNPGVTGIETGFYACTYDQASKILHFQKLVDSHSDLWLCFYKLLQNLIANTKNITAISSDKLECLDILSELKEAISQEKSKTKGNWLSNIRNDVNYHGTNGSWFPYTGQNFDVTELPLFPKKILKQNLEKNLINSTSVLDSSFNTSIRIINILIFLLKTCNSKFLNENYNFKHGSLKMIIVLYS